ncbi:olfactory receptor 142-like [Erpetoichthys calabaricus]|uniref:olfactory receptor 142-like n=1 Tax=Erpetoichthys calabaricus TaxID=27687 RepID=UPI0010A0262E|nr:olfactory receptor 142-like [Erpetoichthys calabaricus]
MSLLNQTDTSVQEFIIVGFPSFQDSESRNVLFSIFLAVYSLILLGNVLLVVVFVMDKGLHIPMYMLICSLALVDLIISTTTIPKMLLVFSFKSTVISVSMCLTQMGFYHTMIATESLLLGLMAYDRYLAICKPLHYFTLMSNVVVLQKISCCWVLGFLVAIVSVILALKLPFCGPNKLIHCFCDHSAVLKLACTDTFLNSYVSLAIALSVLFIPLSFILFSYAMIIRSVLNIVSSEGRLKAFSTCGTHLLIILVFFVIAAGVYISNRVPGTSIDMRIMAALIQNVTPPLMNPIIYCLRTKEIRESFVKTLKRCKILSDRSSQ